MQIHTSSASSMKRFAPVRHELQELTSAQRYRPNQSFHIYAAFSLSLSLGHLQNNRGKQLLCEVLSIFTKYLKNAPFRRSLPQYHNQARSTSLWLNGVQLNSKKINKKYQRKPRSTRVKRKPAAHILVQD